VRGIERGGKRERECVCRISFYWKRGTLVHYTLDTIIACGRERVRERESVRGGVREREKERERVCVCRTSFYWKRNTLVTHTFNIIIACERKGVCV